MYVLCGSHICLNMCNFLALKLVLQEYGFLIRLGGKNTLHLFRTDLSLEFLNHFFSCKVLLFENPMCKTSFEIIMS